MQNVSAVTVYRVNSGGVRAEGDVLATEEPLEIRLLFLRDGRSYSQTISITMRTPGSDFELAVGFLYAEGIIRSADQIKSISRGKSAKLEGPDENVVVVELVSGDSVDFKKLERHFYTTSSCGVCGKTSLEAVQSVGSLTPIPGGLEVSQELLMHLPDLLRGSQEAFEQTGGLHASALFNASGAVISVREDVGRHNALDKLIGSFVMAGEIPLRQCILLISGRTSFELIQKAVMARIPIVAAIGAPSSLAVQLAEQYNITLIGFLKECRFNIYAAPQRVCGALPPR